jgi:hypothetical protein
MMEVIDTKIEANAIHKGLDGCVKNRRLSSMIREV